MPKTSSKPAGKNKIKAGPSGGMHNFQAVGTQKADKTAVSPSGGSGDYAKGGSGKMYGFSPSKAVKKA